MKRITAICLFCVAMMLEGHAQNYLSFSANLSRGNKRFPTNAKTGIGLNLVGYLGLYRSGGVRGSIAYDFFRQKSFKNHPDTVRTLGYHGKNLSFVPLKVGFQQFIVPDKLFVFSNIGISFLQSSSEYLFRPTRLAYDFGAGYNFQLAQSKWIEVCTLYNFNNAGQYKVSDNYFTLRVGYAIE